MLNISIRDWDYGEYVIYIEDIGEIGGILTHDEAEVVVKWLKDKNGFKELIGELYEEPHIIENIINKI